MAAQFKVTNGRFLRGLSRWMARATNSLPGAGFTEDQHVRVGGSNHFHLPQNPPQRRAVPDHLLEVLLALDILVPDAFELVALAQILHKRDPSEGRELQNRRGDQNRNSSSILAEQLLLIGRAGAEPQAFFMRQIIERRVFRGSEIGPVQPARQQVFAAVPHQIEERVIGLGNTVELTGNDAGDGRFRWDGTDARTAAAQLLVPFVTLAEVAHDSGKALQFAVLISQGHRNDVGPESRPVLPHVPAFIPEMALGGGPIQFLLSLRAGILLAGIEKRYVLAGGLISAVAVDARCSRIPVGDSSVHVQQGQRIVLHP